MRRVDPSPGPLARAVARVVGLAAGTEPARVFLALGRHRRLFRAWLPFAATVLLRTELPRCDVELIVLRTAYNCLSAYEWTQHVPLARRAGLSGEAVAAVAGRGGSEALSERDRLLLAGVDELHAHGVVSENTSHALGAAFDELQILELCVVVGHYEMLAMTLATMGVEPEPSALAKLDADNRSVVDELRETLRARALA